MNNKGYHLRIQLLRGSSEHYTTACWTSVPGKQWTRCLTCWDNLSFLSGPCLSPVYSQRWPRKQSRPLNKTARWKGWICESKPAVYFFLHKEISTLSIVWDRKRFLPPVLPGLFKVIALGLQPSICAHFNNLYFCWIIQQSKDLLLKISNLKEKLKACILFIKTPRGGKKTPVYLSSLTLFRTLLRGLEGGNSVLSKVLVMGKTADKIAGLRIKATVTNTI